ncbi:MAG: hypothetical protein JOY62_09370 [Acidobacteriaceae bacterium]|nr:hypothetical protein [Acidobacteriaceae bacterium]MBV9780169.1 hypothetical protein [Acidobacteriaceae bacterium]
MRFDKRGADLGVFFVLELLGKREAADGVDAHFERRDAEQAPFGVGERLRESGFFIAGGFVLIEEALDVLLVSGVIVARQQDGAAGEPGFDRIFNEDLALPSGVFGPVES